MSADEEFAPTQEERDAIAQLVEAELALRRCADQLSQLRDEARIVARFMGQKAEAAVGAYNEATQRLLQAKQQWVQARARRIAGSALAPATPSPAGAGGAATIVMAAEPPARMQFAKWLYDTGRIGDWTKA